MVYYYYLNPNIQLTIITFFVAAEVSIYIQAFSDKNPIFSTPWTPSHPQLEVELKEEEPLDKPVFAVTAKDPVSGKERIKGLKKKKIRFY